MSNPLQSAIAAAQEAGAVLLQHLHGPLHIRQKQRRADLVTEADDASEALIVARLRSEYPDSSILGEEGGERKGTLRERWIIDPLDGTTNFAHGYPLFCVSIAYEVDGEVIAGVVHAPLMKETFVAHQGFGATLNGAPIRVSSIDRVGAAMLCTGFKPSDFATNARQFASASNCAQAVRRDGSAALDLAYTAMGRFDGFWEFDLAPWDTAAGVLLVREAGGYVSDVNAREFSMNAGSVLASNGRIHDELVRVLSQ